MRKFTVAEKARGELAVRRLSKKAQCFYNTSETKVYEYNTEDGMRYAYDYSGCANGYKDHMAALDLTLDQLEADFESYATPDIWSFRQMDIDEQIAYIESLDRWDDVGAEFYETLCEELGLDYRAYDDPDILWRDIIGRYC